jgi:hypothetical protein
MNFKNNSGKYGVSLYLGDKNLIISILNSSFDSNFV